MRNITTKAISGDGKKRWRRGRRTYARERESSCETILAEWMNTLMNSHNGTGRRGSNPGWHNGATKTRLFSGAETKSGRKWEQDRKRKRRDEGKESENEWDGRECRPTNLHYLREEAQLFHADRFRRGRDGNDVGLDRQQNCRTDDIGTKRHDCLSSAAELCTRALAPWWRWKTRRYTVIRPVLGNVAGIRFQLNSKRFSTIIHSYFAATFWPFKCGISFRIKW